MATLEVHLKAVCDQNGVPADFMEWLARKAGFLTMEDAALTASSEDKVTSELIEPAKADNVKLDRLVDKVNVGKMWKVCRKAYGEGTTVGARNSEESLPEGTEKDLKTTWATRHNFELSDHMLLIDTTQGKLWRELGSAQKKLSVYLVEQLRTMDCLNKAQATHVKICPGQSAKAEESIADTVDLPLEVYVRNRALFHTVSCNDQVAGLAPIPERDHNE